MKTTELTDYEKQGIDFLVKHNVEFEAEFLKNGKHFENDKDYRDIYAITLKRGNRSYTFNFGQSIAKSGTWLVDDKLPKFRKTFESKDLAMIYAHEIGNRFNVIKNPDKEAPTAYSVLSCLTKYDPGTFENFCSEFGYDEDSRTAERTYNAVKEEYMNVCALFSDTELEELQEIQ